MNDIYCLKRQMFIGFKLVPGEKRIVFLLPSYRQSVILASVQARVIKSLTNFYRFFSCLKDIKISIQGIS